MTINTSSVGNTSPEQINQLLQSSLNELQKAVKDYMGNTAFPPAADGSTQADSLPTLISPRGGLSLETLLSAIGDEVRRQTVRDSAEGIELKAEQQKEINDKQLKELQEQLEKMKSQKVLDIFKKIFQGIGIALAAVTTGLACATGNPLLIAGAVIGMTLAIDSIASLASDGKYSLATGFGTENEGAKIFCQVLMGALMVANIACNISGAVKLSADVAKGAVDLATKAMTIAAKAGTINNIASGVNSVGTGAVTIGSAVIQYQVENSKANIKDLEAILQRLRDAMDVEKNLMEAELERANALLTDVKELVDGAIDTQTAIVTASPQMA